MTDHDKLSKIDCPPELPSQDTLSLWHDRRRSRTEAHGKCPMKPDAYRADFYISPQGSDRWSGTRPDRNGPGTDGPFATIERARRAVRELRNKRSDRCRPVVVELRGGTYFLNEPMVFAPEDSGTPAAPVIYRAHKHEKPVISGGVRLSGWKVDKRGAWTTRIPRAKRGDWTFSQLFVNGERRSRPRLPATGY